VETSKTKSAITDNFKKNLDCISRDLKRLLDKTPSVGDDFGGPSVYFHKKALLEQKNNFLGKDHLNMIYAVMPSWGMHRMGSNGAKMVDYNSFEKEILKNKDELFELNNKDYKNVDINKVVELITEKVNVSKTKSSLVSSSKVLHHILPNIISPIDRNYSIRFMLKNTDDWGSSSINILNENKKLYAEIFLTEMYNFIRDNEKMMLNYIIEPNENTLSDNNFNTCLTKIFDNLIMVYVKEKKIKDDE
jgi:hypothetical protein